MAAGSRRPLAVLARRRPPGRRDIRPHARRRDHFASYRRGCAVGFLSKRGPGAAPSCLHCWPARSCAVKTDQANDPIIVDRSGATGNHFALDAVWPDGTSWRTELYDRTARPGFTDTSGTELPLGWRGCIDALFGVYAVCTDQGKLTLEVAPASSKRCITRRVRGETPLYSLAEDIRALLATTNRLDATVRLEWVGIGAGRIEIGLFDVAWNPAIARSGPPTLTLSASRHPVSPASLLLATPLADPRSNTFCTTTRRKRTAQRRFAPPISGPGGPWLVYGRVDDRFRIRPRVVFPRPVSNGQRSLLLDLILSSDTAMRRQNLLQLLQSGEATENEIEDARRLIVSFQPRTPLQSLDLAVALIASPKPR